MGGDSDGAMWWHGSGVVCGGGCDVLVAWWSGVVVWQ